MNTHISQSTRTLLLSLFTALLLLTASVAAQGTSKPPVTFAVIGDTGTGDEAQFAVARQMVAQRQKSPFDFVLMLGDNIYEKGEEKLVKPRFEEPYRQLLDAEVKFYAVLGNHDIVRGLEFQTNYKHFHMGGKRYYNFKKGDDDLLEFFALDSNLMDEAQLRWLEEALQKSKAKWKVAFCHHSIYSSARMHSAYTTLRAQLEPLYRKYGVQAVFAGHSHCYERTKPQQGVQYFTVGSSGEIKRGTLRSPSPLTAFGNDQVNIFVLVRATPQQLTFEAIAADGRRLDTHAISR